MSLCSVTSGTPFCACWGEPDPACDAFIGCGLGALGALGADPDPDIDPLPLPLGPPPLGAEPLGIGAPAPAGAPAPPCCCIRAGSDMAMIVALIGSSCPSFSFALSKVTTTIESLL